MELPSTLLILLTLTSLLRPSHAQNNTQDLPANVSRKFGHPPISLCRFRSPSLRRLLPIPHPQALVIVPDDYKVIGGGVKTSFKKGVGQLITRSYPMVKDGRSIGWAVGSKDHLVSDPGTIRAYAIGLHDPRDEWEVHVEHKRSSVTQHPSAVAKLPDGFTLVGGGANVVYKEPGNMLFESYPYSDSEWKASSRDTLYAAPSAIDVYAIGLRARDGSKVEARTFSKKYGKERTINAYLRKKGDWRFVSAGAQISQNGKGNFLMKLMPSKDGKGVRGRAKDHLKEDEENMTLFGIALRGTSWTISRQRIPIN